MRGASMACETKVFFRNRSQAFEHLQAIELIKAVHASAVNTPKEYRMMRMMVEPAQIVEAVMRFQECSTAVRRWGSQWVE